MTAAGGPFRVVLAAYWWARGLTLVEWLAGAPERFARRLAHQVQVPTVLLLEPPAGRRLPGGAR